MKISKPLYQSEDGVDLVLKETIFNTFNNHFKLNSTAASLRYKGLVTFQDGRANCKLVYFQGSYGFWKVLESLEIDNAFFQDLESFGKLIFGPLGYGKVMDFVVACLAYTLQRIVFVVKRRIFFCQHCTCGVRVCCSACWHFALVNVC